MPMEGWSNEEIGAFGTVITGKTPSTKNASFWNGAIPFITPPDLRGKRVTQAQRTITAGGLAAVNPIPRNAVMVCCIGSIGLTGICDVERAATNQQINSVVVDSSRADAEFCHYAIMHSRPALLAAAQITTVPILNKSNFSRIRVWLPPLAEQRQIATVLSAVQRAIERQERLFTLTTDLKKALMHKLFTEGTRGEPLKQTDLWAMPVSWPLRPLGECLALIRNGLTTAQNKNRAGIPITRIETIAGDYVDPERVGFTDAATAAQIESHRLRNGDILMSHINSEPQIGRTVIYRGEPELLLHGMNLLALRCNAMMSPAFLHRLCEYLRARGIFQQIASRAVGQSSINQGKIKALLVPCPTPIEQEEICAPLQAVEARRDLAVRLREGWQQMFDRLLDDLMTARVRLHDLDLATLEEARPERAA